MYKDVLQKHLPENISSRVISNFRGTQGTV